MSAAKIIAVVGATGATAGGLARAILSHPDDGYACRAITRDPGSAAARALSEQGATVVQADLDDYDSLVRAFDGAYGAFCMTNFFSPSPPSWRRSRPRTRHGRRPRPGFAMWFGRRLRTAAGGTRSTTRGCRR